MQEILATLQSLLILLFAAWLFGHFCERVRIPSVIGQIVAGLIVGPSLLGLVHVDPVLSLFGELGAIFLLFVVGLETRLADLLKVGVSATLTGVLGVVVPLIAGILLMLFLGYTAPTALFVGVALVATSVGITSKVLKDLGALSRPFSQVILGAAILDDILAMVLLALVSGLADGGFSAMHLVLLLIQSVVFVLFFSLVVPRFFKKIAASTRARQWLSEPLIPVVVLLLAISYVSAQVGLAAVIGAFLAGLSLSEVRHELEIEKAVEPVYTFFAPFFFVLIGVKANLGAFSSPSVVSLAIIVTLLAIVTKFLGALVGSLQTGARNALLVGIGMVPRGEVGIIVASLGVSLNVISNEIFLSIVTMSIFTTIIVPPLLARLISSGDAGTNQ